MRFVKFNFEHGEAFLFSLDQLVTFKSKDRDTIVVLSNCTTESLMIDIDDFCTKVFSDEHGDNDYQLVEIDNKRPTPSIAEFSGS